jgi:hypothetical protein
LGVFDESGDGDDFASSSNLLVEELTMTDIDLFRGGGVGGNAMK